MLKLFFFIGLFTAGYPVFKNIGLELTADEVLQNADMEPRVVLEDAFERDYDAFEMNHYDARAFSIAQILDRQRISSSAEEILDLSQLILDKSEEIGVSPSLILAMIEVESTFRPCARSRVGAKGLMQVMPHRILGYQKTRREFAFRYHEFYEPEWNISFGADYLGTLIRRYGDVEAALSAYNWGPTKVTYQLRNSSFSGSKYATRVFETEKQYTRLR